VAIQESAEEHVMPRHLQQALAKLVNDEQYRTQVKNDPQRITKDFRLTHAELNILMAIGNVDGNALNRHEMLAGGCSSSSGGYRSDRRLKNGIRQIATLPSGIRLYRFRYRGNKTEYLGVVAQQVSKIAPHAVTRGRDGFLRVDYGALGLKTLPSVIHAGSRSANGAVA
jgi:endosialidase-like protein